MPTRPRISIVTPSYNQGRFLRRTIESVRSQNYPDVEHIVVDGMSTDDTCRILADYPELRIIREPDHGQAEAINKGMRLATGTIRSFLNSDDTLLPGALHRVAAAIDPARGRHVVMGRCIYIDENDRPVGHEHLSEFQCHRRVLQIWKGHRIPQPAVFWTEEAWRRSGPLDERERLVLDYDLFCRMSARCRFHFINHLLATYRLHSDSKTCTSTWDRVLREGLRISRRYWGPPWLPFYWGLQASYWWYPRWSHACTTCSKYSQDYFLRSRVSHEHGQRWRARCQRFLANVLRPGAALRNRLRLPPPVRAYQHLSNPAICAAVTRIWASFSGLHPDAWVGPNLRLRLPSSDRSCAVVIRGTVIFMEPRWPAMELVFSMGERCLHRERVESPGEFTSRFMLGECADTEFVVAASHFFVPHDFNGLGDHRPLSWRLVELSLETEQPQRNLLQAA
jgi:glycosyltransferase involved in cell wall biosynthesis